MSSIIIHDLAHSALLDKPAMSLVTGGNAFGKDVNVNVNVNQQVAQFQQIGISVLNNNGIVGANFKGPDIEVAAALWAENHAEF